MESHQNPEASTITQESQKYGGYEPDADFVIWQFFGWLALGILIVSTVLALCELSSYLWRPIAILLYGLLFVSSIGLLVILNLAFHASVDIEMEAGAVSMCVTAAFFSVSQLSRHSAILSGGYVANNFEYWHWLRLGAANFLEAVLFDVPQIYEWDISEIRATTFWSRSILFVFRTALEFVVVVAILNYGQKARKYWKKENNPPTNFLIFIFSRFGQLLLTMLVGVPCAIVLGAIINDGLSLGSTWEIAIRLAPLVFGGWLVVNSFQGLRISGTVNRLLCLASIGISGWMIRENWSALMLLLGQ